MPDEPRDESEDKGFNVPVQQKKVIEPLNTEEVVREQGSAPFGPVESEEPSLYKEEPIPVVEAELEPTTMSSDQPLQSPVVEQSVKQPVSRPVRGKKMIIGGALLGVFVLLGAGTALAYNVWYQNPQKVIGDAIANSMTAKSMNLAVDVQSTSKPQASSPFTTVQPEGFSSESTTSTLAVKADANYEVAKIDVNFDLKGGAQDVNTKGSAILDYKNSSYYVQIKQLARLVELFAGPAEQTPPEVGSLLKKIDENWIKITDQDINQTSGITSSNDVSSCVQKAIEKMSTDDSYKSELTNLYRDNPIIIVDKKLGSKEGMLGYEIMPSIQNTNEFIRGFNTSAFYTEVKKCDDAIKDVEPFTESTPDTNLPEPTVSVWVDRWSHELQEVTVNSDNEYSSVTSTAVVNFNQTVEATIPENVIDATTLKADLEKIKAAYDQNLYAEFAQDDVLINQSIAAAISKKAEIYGIITGTYPTYDEFMQGNSMVEEARLDEETKRLLSPNRPDTKDTSLIQYEQCNEGSGATIRYFDIASNTVGEYGIGECSTPSV